MSEEMAVGDKASSDENKVGSEDAAMDATDSVDVSKAAEETESSETEVGERSSESIEGAPSQEVKELEETGIPSQENAESEDEPKDDEQSSIDEGVLDDKSDDDDDNDDKADKAELENEDEQVDKIEDQKKDDEDEEDDIKSKLEHIRGIKRRASSVFSDDAVEEFKGFDNVETRALADYSRIVEEDKSVNRRPSTSSNIEDDGFKGFHLNQHNNLSGYSQVLERLEAEVSAAVTTYKPLRTVMAAPPVRPNKRARQDAIAKWSDHLEEEVTAFVKSFSDEATVKPGKRQRQGTDGSRPSSALSSRSDGDGAASTDASSSPAARGGRRTTVEMSSPLLRVPMERGWKRELVYRATVTNDNRRNADIYYYTPQGKKLRSTREVSEHLGGTGLTLENFSFFKEPLGLDDPEKEIIRDAKVMRRVESPVPAPAPAAPTVDGKRTPKLKTPKGASPEPANTKSPPAKLKVKSFGSRLSTNGTSTPKPTKKAAQAQQQPQPQPQSQPQPQPQPQVVIPLQPQTQSQPQQQPQPVTAPADNNNTAAWKKPRGLPPLQPRPPPAAPTAPPVALRDTDQHQRQVSRQMQQPCSMSCGRGAVPSLACAACLCLYHPACVGFTHAAPPERFLCKNCRKSSSPPLEPPPLTHKSGISTHQPQLPNTSTLTTTITANAVANIAGVRRMPVPVPAKVPKNDKRVLLRMKVSGGGPDGERVWAVAKPPSSATPPTTPVSIQPPVATPTTSSVAPPSATPPVQSVLLCRPGLPQSLAIINGRRFIVVARALHHEGVKGPCGRLANGEDSPPSPGTPTRRRGRPRADEADFFTPFYHKAQENNYNIAVQIFQYLGMRELSRCARVCKLWQQLAATPALWRHVRMKNSHVSDWAGVCAALKRHGTRWLDLRKMLLPQNDSLFWDHFAQHIGTVDTLERLELCRCPARAVEAACERLPGLRALAAPAIRDARLDPTPLAGLPRLELLRLKSLAGLSLTRDLRPLAALSKLQHLSLTSIKELGWCACEVVGQLEQLESLELGECSFGGSFATALGKLVKLRRLRLERGVAHCAAPALLRALAALPKLTRLELVNFDVKVGFDDALAECKNIQRLLIIPTYVSQSATTNKQVLSGVLRLKETLTHLMWGVTIELLRVTELFIDQCEAGEGESKRRDVGECIPVLKPVPGCRLPDDHRTVAGPPQVEILPIPTLQRLLSAQLPNTKLKLLRIPFHATWRQSLADFQ